MRLGYFFVVLLLLASCAQEQVVEENVSVLNDLGVYYASQGENEQAKEYFNKVLGIDLSHEIARKNLALIYHQQGNYDKAIEHFTMLTQMYPQNPSYHYDLAISIADNCRVNQVCDLDKAIAEFNRAEELEPGYQMAAENIEALTQVQKELNTTNSSQQPSAESQE